MNQNLAISARGLGKRYRRGVSLSQQAHLRDAILDGLRSILGQRASKGSGETFWALKDASFDIARGENVGIIGLNGAGKSTLLKILSRITTPTEGVARVAGRVGALLEVGTGFHQELTGRENAFLYGSILGMSRRELARKFDAIVDFAEIEDFIDTPVKRYSSGMYVRLAFSVAAHLDPDILLLDEVLAVGDYTFQRKCMKFARELEQKGATILFVSHNMFSIKTMCERVIYLKKGRVVYDGPTDGGLKLYEEDCRLAAAPWFKDETHKPSVRITAVEICDENGVEKSVFDFGERMKIRLSYEALRPVEAPDFLVSIARSDEILCCNFSTISDNVILPRISGSGTIELRTPPLNIVSEMYTIQITVRERGHGDVVCAQIGGTFHIRHPVFAGSAHGVFHLPGEWTLTGADALEIV